MTYAMSYLRQCREEWKSFPDSRGWSGREEMITNAKLERYGRNPTTIRQV